jgi:hypothetical protein
MTWLAPWAFVGLVAVAGPLLAHWLARRQADRVPFPTLQFLMPTPPVSVRRHRLRDIPLMLVRMLIVIAAVAALAQPVWRRPAAPAAQPARAIVIDASASLQRAGPDGRPGTEVARAAASALEAEARDRGVPVLVEPAADLPAGVVRASAWLARQPAPRELVLVSDFQVGALMAADLDVVPADAGIRLVPVTMTGPVPATPAPARAALRVRAGGAHARSMAAAEAAAIELVGAASTRPETVPEIQLMFPSAPEYPAARAAARPVDSPELFALVRDIARERRRLGTSVEQASAVVFAQHLRGLTVFADADLGSADAAVLMAAILRAAAPVELPLAEREPDSLEPGLRERWQRGPTASDAPFAQAGTSDGRWLWALVLVLFAVEWRMRG